MCCTDSPHRSSFLPLFHLHSSPASYFPLLPPSQYSVLLSPLLTLLSSSSFYAFYSSSLLPLPTLLSPLFPSPVSCRPSLPSPPFPSSPPYSFLPCSSLLGLPLPALLHLSSLLLSFFPFLLLPLFLFLLPTALCLQEWREVKVQRCPPLHAAATTILPSYLLHTAPRRPQPAPH